MKRRSTVLWFGFVALSLPLFVNGDEATTEALLAERHCDACHHVSRTLLGPSYEAIAARHAARKDAMVEVLAHKIIVGGAGNWGVVPMVPNEHVTVDEARAMARWILALQ